MWLPREAVPALHVEDLLGLDPAHKLLYDCAKSWRAAATAMHDSYTHTGFDWQVMQPIDNGQWTEGDAAGGVAGALPEPDL